MQSSSFGSIEKFVKNSKKSDTMGADRRQKVKKDKINRRLERNLAKEIINSL